MNRPKKKNRQPRKDAMLTAILEARPQGGEDFWLFSLVQDDHKPTWQKRYTTFGTYDQCAHDIVALTHTMMERGMKMDCQIESYQGQQARNFLANVAKEEAKYQQENRNQPNN